MGKQSGQHSISPADLFNDPNWTFVMACAWVAHRTRAGVEAAARGHGRITRTAVERLLGELRAGRLVAWGAIDGKALAISPQRWRTLEPAFARKRFLPGFAETFGRLIITISDSGAGQTIQRITISSEAVQKIFPANDLASAYQVRQPQRERARMGLEGRFGQKIPPPSEMSNKILCKEVLQWLAKHHPLPSGYSEISNDSILRAAGRKQ